MEAIERQAHDDERRTAEDLDTAAAVQRFQAGDRDAFSLIYSRYFERVYTYLRLVLRDPHEAEDVAQQAFLEVFQALPSYEERRRPFRAWLFTVVRNRAISHVRRSRRVELEGDELINQRRERRVEPESVERSAAWIADGDLIFLIERLPAIQRQALVLRYMLDLDSVEIAAVLGRSPEAVRMLQHRALTFLRERLSALGREPGHERWARSGTVLRKARVVRLRKFMLSNPGPTG